MITKELAMSIWRCYQEIESAQKLHEECKEMIDKVHPDHWRDSFGRERGLEMGVPSGDNSRRIFQVNPTAALLVLTDHIHRKTIELENLQSQAQDALRSFSHR